MMDMPLKNWNDLSQTEMAHIVSLYKIDKDHPKLHDWMHTLNINDLQTLQRHCRNYLQYETVFLGSRGITLMDDDLDPTAPALVTAPTLASRLTDIHHITPGTDQAAWLAWLGTQDRYLTVMHLCDIHFPFHDNGALGLAYQLVAQAQPNMVVVGSDAFDFSLLSSFGVDPDTDVGYEDELDGMERYWNAHIREIKQRAPDARLVYILGNHERRIITYLIKQAPALRKTVMRRFIDLIRCNGSVWWLGEVDRVRVGPLLVQHGNRHGTNVAKALLDDQGYQVSTMLKHKTSRCKLGYHLYHDLRWGLSLGEVDMGKLCIEQLRRCIIGQRRLDRIAETAQVNPQASDTNTRIIPAITCCDAFEGL